MPNRGYALIKECNESHTLQAGTSAQCIVRRVYLASINVKSEGSILIEETVIHSHCVFKEICGAVCVVREKFTRPSNPASCKPQWMWLVALC